MQYSNIFESKQTFDRIETKCPLCGSAGISPKYDIDRYAIRFSVHECNSCGFLFMNPPLSGITSAALYDENYFMERADYSYCDERKALRFFRYVWDRRIGVIRRYVPSGRFLDVGCSFGGFLQSASSYFETFGIELSPYAAEHATRFSNAYIHVGTLESQQFDEGSFHVITMVELIEHLRNPINAIEQCYRLLAPGGLLVIQTANMAGLQARIMGKDYSYFMPGHMSYFNRKNLTGALKRSGFERIIVYQPVEFGLIPKLKKSRYTFTLPVHYFRWIRISLYHFASLVHAGDFALTSSMVIYALKPDAS